MACRGSRSIPASVTRAKLGGSAAERAAAAVAVAHTNTPTTTRLDVLGRPVAVFVRWRDDEGREVVTATRQHLDVLGNVVEVVDARGNVAEHREYDMLGRALVVRSVDAGESRALVDAVGAPLRMVDAHGHVQSIEYDGLRRPIEHWVSVPGEADVLVTKRVWGDGINDGRAGGSRQRGRVVRVYDGGGETRVEAYDLDGNATAITRRLVDLPKQLAIAKLEGQPQRARMSWAVLGGIVDLAEIDTMLTMTDALDTKVHRTTARYDAHGRVVETTLPLSGSTHRTRYTEDGLLRRIDRETAAGTTERVYEADDFDHLGRPRAVHHGDDAAHTRLSYDPITERLVRLQARGGGRALQDLQYTYDPSGNITQVRDAAQATIFRDGAALEASNDYRYDALYRLVEATGREHEGQAANGRAPERDVVPLRAVSPSDPQAMRRYVQRFCYDAVGNLTRLQHHAGAGSFRREYAYAEHGNRLRATGNAATALHERYEHDVAGNMIAMPHISRLSWNELGQLEQVQCGTQRVWLQYVGDARVRKVVLSGEGVVEDRIYLEGEELYTKRRAKAQGGAVVEQTLTEHVGGGLQVDVKLVADGKVIGKPVALRRYAVADHLGSAKLEVDPAGRVIAYEEFHPYGTTSYRAMRSGLDAAANRFRFTGMERDDETGLTQHGARYYAAWLGRWTTGDPIGIGDGVNRFAYCRGNPIGYVDTDGLAAQAPDEDMMAAPRSRARSRMYAPQREPWSGPEDWEREFYDGDPMGTGFMDGMRGTHASEVSPVGRLADVAVRSVGSVVDVAGTLAGLGVYMLVGPEGRNIHFLLDVAGLFPGPIGIAADLVNAGFYALQGDTKNMALSAVSAIGGVVDALKAKKLLEEGMVLMMTGGSTKLTTRAARGQEQVVSARRPPAPENYRGRYNAAQHAEGKARLPDDWDAHHRIPQEYRDHPEFRDFDFHAPSNIQGVKGSRADVNLHQDVTNLWADFRKANPQATRAQIEDFAQEMDVRFQKHWWSQ